MNLEKHLTSTLYKEDIAVLVHYIGRDTHRFSDLMDLFFSDNKRLAQRAAWAVSHCVNKEPGLVQPYLTKMVDNLYVTEATAIKRNTVRILQLINIPEPLWGKVIDKCFEYLSSAKETIAVKAFSMTVAYRISEDVPEIKQELKLLIEDMMLYASPGIRSRGNKILKVLNST